MINPENQEIVLALQFNPAISDWDNYTDDQWRAFIDNSYPRLKVKSENLAKLMRSFADGVKFVRDEYEQKKYPTSLKNKPIVLYNMAGGPPATQHKDNFLDVLGVEVNFLAGFQELDPEEVFEVTDDLDEIIFEGTLLQLFRSMGIEEAHHSVFSDKKSQSTQEISSKNNRVEYDAQDHEFRSLFWKLKDALRGKNIDGAKHIQKRIDEARALRVVRKKNP